MNSSKTDQCSICQYTHCFGATRETGAEHHHAAKGCPEVGEPAQKKDCQVNGPNIHMFKLQHSAKGRFMLICYNK